MNTFNQKILFVIVILIYIFYVHGSNKIKREYEHFYPVSDVTSDLADQDLEAGLRSLSSSELRTLSQFIDEESHSPESKAFLDAMNKYWKGRKGTKFGKKKRTIDDLYDEVAHENAELEIISERGRSLSKAGTNDGKCHCEPNRIKDNNMRTKRDNLGANVQEEHSIEEYVRDLEDSFPRDQGENINGGENNMRKNGHIRIKRL